MTVNAAATRAHDDGSPALQAARAISAASEPFTLWGLFRPETAEALALAGLDPKVSYLAVRAAPLGAAAPAVVVAAFRSLPAEPIRAVMPSVWSKLTPEQLLDLTHDSISAACRTAFLDSPLHADVAAVADLLESVVSQLDTSGRPLAAGGQAVPLPNEPWARAWRLLTTLREHRGDAHVAALVTSNLTLPQTEVLMAAWAGGHLNVTALRQTRGLTDQTWDKARQDLTQRGLLRDDGTISPAGRELRDHLEHLTDVASTHAWAAADPDATVRIYDFARAASAHLVDTGRIPAVTPVGVVWPPHPLPLAT
jgi:hypothetical protein